MTTTLLFALVLVAHSSKSYYSQAFVPSHQWGSSVGVPRHDARPQLTNQRRARQPALCSMATESPKSKSSEVSTQPHQSNSNSNSNSNREKIHALNLELDKLAQKCFNAENPVLVASQCEELYNTSDAVDAVSFNTLLKAWKHTCASLAEHRQHPINSFDKSEIPTVAVYTARDAAQHATNLLLTQKEKQDEDSPVRLDTTSYNIVMDTWSKSRVDDAPQACERLLKRMLDQNVEPDTVSYNSVLDAWSHSKSDQSLERVLKIWRYMESLHKEGNIHVKPTIRTVNCVVAAHAKHVTRQPNQESAMPFARAAHDILDETKRSFDETHDVRYQLDIKTYNSVMDAYSKVGSWEAIQAAEALMKEIKENDNGIEPNHRTYTALITAWSKTKTPKPLRCEELLEEMHASDSSGNMKPNNRAYTCTIQAWAKSRDSSKPQRALRLLKKMKQLAQEGDVSMKPNLLSYNAAIDACARCGGDTHEQTEALKIAFAMLKSLQMDHDLQPNQTTYATTLKATAYLLPPGSERNKVASALFEKARAAGMIDLNMIQNMRKAVDNSVMQSLLVEMTDNRGHLDYNKIPRAWSRNIR